MADTNLVAIQKEVTLELTNKKTVELLLHTTFKGLSQPAMAQAITEGMLRGFVFKDFLEKNVYAIPFKEGYALVTSIDHARKIGARSGVVGKSKPEFDVDEAGKVISCTITIQKKVAGEIGNFSDTAYFAEYYKAGRNGYPSLWESKPRTMIAKVAEMHALRMACPEEMSQLYAEEELEKEIKPAVIIDLDKYKAKIESAETLEELQTIWSALPPEAKADLKEVKENHPLYPKPVAAVAKPTEEKKP